MTKLLEEWAKKTAPQLNKLMGSKRPLAIDWRRDPVPRPPHHAFDPKLVLHNIMKEQLEKSRKLLESRKIIDLRRPYRILCLDGGGVRGALTTALMTRICEHNPKFLDHVDLICGTSAGGILSLLLASGYTPKECDEVYGFAAKHIFGHNPWRVINPFRAKYSDKAKQELMMHYFGERTMADLQKTCAVIAFRLDGKKSKTHSFFNKEGWRPAVFTNMPRASGLVEPDNDLKVWDAAMCTSAAPTFFPVFRGYVDGGIVANNPSIIAIAKAVAHYKNVTPKNIALLSIGAGYVPRHTNVFSSADDNNKSEHELHHNGSGPSAVLGAQKLHDGLGNMLNGIAQNNSSLLYHADWGIKQWLPFLVDLLLDGDSVTTEMAAHYLLDHQGMYHRLDPRLPENVKLDDVSAMAGLRDLAQTIDLTKTLKFVDENFAYDNETFDNELHNSLDHASTYNDAWMNSMSGPYVV